MCKKDRICPEMDNGKQCCQTGYCTFCPFYYENNTNVNEKCKGCPINLNLEENAD